MMKVLTIAARALCCGSLALAAAEASAIDRGTLSDGGSGAQVRRQATAIRKGGLCEINFYFHVPDDQETEMHLRQLNFTGT